MHTATQFADRPPTIRTLNFRGAFVAMLLCPGDHLTWQALVLPSMSPTSLQPPSIGAILRQDDHTFGDPNSAGP